MIKRRTCLNYAGALAAATVATPALAQAKYPNQPIKIWVALPAGGSVDLIARTLGPKLSAALGQPVIVDNRGGGSGQIGMSLVAKSPADGHTLIVSPASFLTTNKSVFRALPYDPEADFAPITRLVNQPMVMVVKDKQKYPTVGAFLAAAAPTTAPTGLDAQALTAADSAAALWASRLGSVWPDAHPTVSVL